MGRLFDERDTVVRLILLDLSGLGYLLFRPHPPGHPTAWQWALAVTAFTVILALYRTPTASFLVQVGLLAVAQATLDDPTINQVGASWALLELSMAARRRGVVWALAALLATVYGVRDALDDPSLAGVGRTLFGLGVVVGVPLLLGLNVRAARELATQAAERAAQERLRHEADSRAARSAERATIARELHDVVAHHVASMVLRVGVARHVLPDADPRVAEVFDDVHATGTAALADLRRLVSVLRADDPVSTDAAVATIEPASLPAALGATVDRARRTGLVVDADIAPAVAGLDAVRGLAVLRLTQEALTNVARHAGPTARARVTVAVRDDDALVWEVRDDGADGAPPAADRSPGGGHGLTGMRERVQLLGGRLEAGPHGTGWRLRTVLPGALPAGGAP
jgi:signal transduction histidine kinase